MHRLALPAFLLAIVGFMSTGCTPSTDDNRRDNKTTVAKAEPSASKEPSGSAASDGAEKKAEPSSSLAERKSSPARGPIPVDAEGYVTLGTPAQASTDQASTAQASAATKPLVKPTAEPDATTGQRVPTASTAPNAAATVPATVASSSGSSVTKSTTTASNGKTESKPENKQPSAESGLATYDEKHQKIAEDWPKPQALLFFTGQQHGYIEPCGCTGLENQKGGLNRRDTLLTMLRDRGWDVLPMDVGNFERRVGRQAEIKFQTTVEALKDMGYRCATLGVDDLKLSSTHLLALTATEGKTETPFISANAFVLIEEYMPKTKIIEVGGRKLGVTAVLGDSFKAELSTSSDIIIAPAAESLKPVVSQLKKAGCDTLILLAHASLEESQELAKQVPEFDLVVTAGGYPEPQYQLEQIEGNETKIAQVGAKGMYAVMVGLYPDGDKPMRYQRVALSSQFPDSPRMLERFGNYQKQLESIGLEGLGVRPQALAEGLSYVGSDKCGECHTKAFEVWKNSGHFKATESLVKPPNDRSMIPRHHDPECLSCHVTGWNPQSYYPYATGFASLEKTPNLTGNGCENCHGPGSTHAAAEGGDIQADDQLMQQLREKMRVPLAEARDGCIRCHDQDNSPDFQPNGAFEEYWQKIAHPGKD